MPWPMSQDYNEAIQNPASSFGDPDLKRGQVVTNAMGLPMPCSGNFAEVYAVTTPQRKWAVKCFTREIPGLRERYIAVSKYLIENPLPFLVEFTYLDQGMRIRGQWYPILKMQWVEGLPLNQFVKDYLDKPQLLDTLSQMWVKLSRRLHDVDLAHCDLQHRNILMVHGTQGLGPRLLDYDGMCVPGLTELKSIKVGHPNFQHPQRLREGFYGLEADRFSHLVIYTALRALIVGGKALWDKYDNGDNLLFKQTDFVAPDKSPLFAVLNRMGDSQVGKLVSVLAQAATRPVNRVPLLQESIPISANCSANFPAISGALPARPQATVESGEAQRASQSLLSKAIGLVTQFGAPFRYVAKMILNTVLPGSPAIVELVMAVIETAQEVAGKRQLKKEALVSGASEDDLRRVEEILGLLSADMQQLVAQMVRLKDTPEMAQIALDTALLNDRRCREAGEKINRLAEEITHLKKRMDELSAKQDSGNEMLRGILDFQRMNFHVFKFIEELQRFNISPAEMIKFFEKYRNGASQLGAGKVKSARKTFLELEKECPKSAAVAAASAAAQAADNDTVNAKKTLARVTRLVPRFEEKVRTLTRLELDGLNQPGPVQPYPDSILAGALSPRQIAEKMKQHPREASALLQNGAILRWFNDNGWTYPVSGPTASGLGAVQQFFESLGLSIPPKVYASVDAIVLRGNKGELLTHSFEVKSDEKRPVYADAVADKPWLEVSRTRLNGNVATIFLRVSIPDWPNSALGFKKPNPADYPTEKDFTNDVYANAWMDALAEDKSDDEARRVAQEAVEKAKQYYSSQGSLHANLTVTANGNQKFVIPVTLHTRS